MVLTLPSPPSSVALRTWPQHHAVLDRLQHAVRDQKLVV